MSTTPTFREFFRYWLRLGFIKAEVAMGIPLGVYGKSPFFDRKTAPAPGH